MKFPLIQLYSFNRSKPIVGIDITEVQWDYCDLEGLPPERERVFQWLVMELFQEDREKIYQKHL